MATVRGHVGNISNSIFTTLDVDAQITLMTIALDVGIISAFAFISSQGVVIFNTFMATVHGHVGNISNSIFTTLDVDAQITLMTIALDVGIISAFAFISSQGVVIFNT